MKFYGIFIQVYYWLELVVLLLSNENCNHGNLLGENALHMAIVIEDPSMVKFLLDKGADYHQRCCGAFFTPFDQKDSRTDSADHEWVDVCQETNYEG